MCKKEEQVVKTNSPKAELYGRFLDKNRINRSAPLLLDDYCLEMDYIKPKNHILD